MVIYKVILLIKFVFFLNKQAVWPHSGHYRPTPENFQDFVSFLKDNVVDISDVKVN